MSFRADVIQLLLRTVILLKMRKKLCISIDTTNYISWDESVLPEL